MWGYLLLLPLCQSIEGNAQNFLDDKLKSATENIYKFLLTTHLQQQWQQHIIMETTIDLKIFTNKCSTHKYQW